MTEIKQVIMTIGIMPIKELVSLLPPNSYPTRIFPQYRNQHLTMLGDGPLYTEPNEAYLHDICYIHLKNKKIEDQVHFFVWYNLRSLLYCIYYDNYASSERGT